MNIDGQQRSGPFPIDAAPAGPAKPFLFLTKETELHPRILAAFEASGRAGDGSYRATVPAASHQQFADGPMFEPTLNPLRGTARKVVTVTGGFALAFFDLTLRGAPRSVLGDVPAPTDVLVAVHPLTRG